MTNQKTSQEDGFRWVMLSLFVLLSLCVWGGWFAQAPLLKEYWGKVHHISEGTANLLLSVPGVDGILLGVFLGRWVDTLGTKNLLGIGAICGVIGFGLRPFFMDSFTIQVVLTAIAGLSIVALTATLGPLMIQWFGHEASHTYIGIGASSFFIGGGLGIIGTSALVGHIGITATFAIYSVLILIMTLVWWALARTKSSAGQPPSFFKEFEHVMQTGSAWVNLIFALLISGTMVFTMGFLPMQMVIAHKLSPALAGTIAGLFPIAMAVGLIFLPPLAGWLGKKVTAIILGIATVIVWIIYMNIATLTIGGLVIVALVFGLFFNVPWSLGLSIQETLPGVNASNMGVAAGAYTVATNVGVFFLPLIMGSMVGHFELEGGMLSILIVYLLALLAMLFVREKRSQAVILEGQSQPGA
jgi:nitrate/nitrite transporter NarK